MKAFRLPQWLEPPELVEVPIPVPGPGEVLIKVAGAGACHSDLHLMDWPPGTMPFDPPFTLGHENAGWIAGWGDGVSGLTLGDAVIIHGPWGCGRCRACRESKENYCERQAEIGVFGGGLGLDGGMAEYMLVPSPRLLVPLGDLDPRDAAPLTDAALTPYHAIARSLHKLVPGSSAVVIGAGGLGHMAVQILEAISCAQVIVVDKDAGRLELAREVGAEVAVLAGEDAAELVKAATGGRGAELVVDLVGSDETLALATAVGRPEGDVTVVGIAGGKLEYDFFALPWECSLQTTYWGSGVELAQVIALARAGKIRAHVRRFTLDQAAEAYDLLRRGEIDGRAVICPNG